MSARCNTHSHLSRRRFLAASSAAVAAPLIIPATALGRDEAAAPSERVTIGYIGTGRRAPQIQFGNLAQIVANADIYQARAEKFASSRKCQPYTDYRALLDRKDIDAVVVASPDHWHTLHSVHACIAGKDVYCEKPMTLTIREGRQLVNAVRKHKRVFQTGSQQRSLAANRYACELVRNGRLGEIKEVYAANYESPWHCALPGQSVPAGLDWDQWCGQAEPVPFSRDVVTPRSNPGWISFRRFSGGEMTGWGAHGLDQIQWALGMDESGPTEIWTEGPAFAPPTFTQPASRSEGNRQCNQPIVCMKYANGITLKFDGGPKGGGKIVGSEGTLWVDRGKFKSDPPEITKTPIKSGDERLYKSDHHTGNFVECIKSRERCVADVEIGHRSATVCHLGNIARWVGKKLTWDPAQEQFVGENAAEGNALVAREQRQGFEIPDV